MIKLEKDTLGMERFIVLSKQGLKDMVKELEASDVISFDTETTGLNYRTCQLVGVSFSNGEKGWYVPLGHTEGEQIPLYFFIDTLRGVFENEEIAKVCHNMKFDYQIVTSLCGFDIKGQWLDTMIAGWLLDENDKLGLKHLSKKYLDYTQTEFEEVAGKKARFQDASILDAGAYATDDAIVTFRLMQFMAPRLEMEQLDKVFLEVEMPFVRVLADMEMEGFTLDVDYLKNMGEWIDGELVKAQQKVLELTGKPINMNSPKQVANLLFEELKLPVVKRTSTGAPSTDAEVLSIVAKKNEVASYIHRFKKLSKIKGTYITGLLERLQDDGKVHGSFNHTGTVTGRLSSSNPNLQNIPSRDKETKIKTAFIAPKGYKMINADFSQIELRIMAHFSLDEAMVEAYERGEDIHARTASQLSGVPYEDFREASRKKDADEPLNEHDQRCLTLRQLAKSVNFGLIYGMGPQSLAMSEGITEKEARDYINDYFSKFSGVKRFIDKTHSLCAKYGYVRSLTGRKRRLPNIHHEQFKYVASARRRAVNSKIQGSAGDLMKLVMNELHYNVLPKYGAKLISQVHDEIIVIVPEEVAEECKEAVADAMKNTVKLRVPIEVDIRVCDNWHEGH